MLVVYLYSSQKKYLSISFPFYALQETSRYFTILFTYKGLYNQVYTDYNI